MIGLRVVAENEERFARVVVANTGLSAPTNSETPTSGAFMQWKARNQAMVDSGNIETGALIATVAQDPSVKDAYDAPFPDPSYKAGPLIMPQRVPVSIAYPGAVANAAAWEGFRKNHFSQLSVTAIRFPPAVIALSSRTSRALRGRIMSL